MATRYGSFKTCEPASAQPDATLPPRTSADDAGHKDEDAEEQEDRTGREPSEKNEPIVHGTAPASSLPDPKNNEPQVAEVPPAANNNSPPPAELPARERNNRAQLKLRFLLDLLSCRRVLHV
jgi:hypothetical protein